ncbi:MAG: hypothetical protein NZP34_06640, partial [Caldilineales bacterium]|nr:hypothetical protein [Caldilineales bacterium]
RTFAPFVAGIGAMTYPKFVLYNVVGGIVWVTLFTMGGYFFGTLPVVQRHFELVVIAIIAISVMPMGIEVLRSRLRPVAKFEEVV